MDFATDTPGVSVAEPMINAVSERPDTLAR
jgi:hypothetical protein